MMHLFSPAPSLDLEVELQSSLSGKIGLLKTNCFSPGGKAVNIARFLNSWGYRYSLVLGAGGGQDPTHVLYGVLLRRENLKATYLDPVAPIRLNLVTHGTFGASKYNHAGHSLSEKALSIYERKDLRKLEKGDVWVFAGRAPRGISPQRLKRWILKLESRGVRCVVDTSGPFLASALTAKPSFLKVNLHEMGEALGRRFLSLDAFWEILPSLQKMGLYYGAVTDGSNGAVVWEGAEVVEAHPPRLKETQSCVVGAGDAFLAGYLKAWREKWTLRDRVCWAVAAGATVAECGIGGFDPKKVARKVRQVSLE